MISMELHIDKFYSAKWDNILRNISTIPLVQANH